MNELLKHYKWDLLITVLVFAGVLYTKDWSLAVLVTLTMLVALEVSFSFDNAVVNAKVLAKMNHFWQTIFLTVGIFIAVFVVRFVFPIAIVMFTAGLGWNEVLNLALSDPAAYGERLEEAHGQIAMLGGVYLLMISLMWFLDRDDRDHDWIGPAERSIAKLSSFDVARFTVGSLTVASTIAAILILGISYTAPHDASGPLLTAGFLSLGVYIAIAWLNRWLESHDDEGLQATGSVVKHGGAAFGLFCYLEVQDAVFSFDGVTGAFAVTKDVVIIAAGLGIGALFVRSMSIHLLRTGKLAELRYLDHGAHWAIGILAICLLLSVFFPISEYITGMLGVVFIVTAVLHSRHANKRDDRQDSLYIA